MNDIHENEQVILHIPLSNKSTKTTMKATKDAARKWNLAFPRKKKKKSILQYLNYPEHDM